MAKENLLYKRAKVARPLEDMGAGATHPTYTQQLQARQEDRISELEEMRRKNQQRSIMGAIELAKNSASSSSDSTNQVNAGDNRVTQNPYTYQNPNQNATQAYGSTYAANQKPVVDTTKRDSLKEWAKSDSISKEQSLQHANSVYEPYRNNAEVNDLLKQYYDASEMLEADKMTGNDGYGRYRQVRNKQKLEKQIRDITGLSKKDFAKLAENYTYLKHDEEAQQMKSDIQNSSGLEKAALTVANIPTAAIGSYYAMVGALDTPNDPELGRDYNSMEFMLRNINQNTKEAVHKDIDDSTMADYQKAIAGFGYDAFTMGAESAASQMLGGAGLASFFAGGYANALEEGEQRGLSKGQAQGYALVSGGLEYATEKIPWEGLKSIYSGKAVSKEAVKGSLMPYVKAFLKQAGEEAGEEVVNGLGDILADSIINSDKSKLNIAINNYMAEGLSEEEATRRAFFDEGKDIVYAAASAAVSAGASAGPALAMQAAGETKAGREIAKDQQYTNSLVRDDKSANYISQDIADYDTQEAFDQAQQTRKDIFAASEKAAKNERISGREARALYENLYDVQKTSADTFVSRAKAQQEENAIREIINAKTASELETIKESNINSEEVQKAVELKKAQMIEEGKASTEDFVNAITPIKAQQMAYEGKEIAAEELEKLPEKVQKAYDLGYSQKAHEITQDITNRDVIEIEFNQNGKDKIDSIKSVSKDSDGVIVFETTSGATVRSTDATYTKKGQYLYNGPSGILSLDKPALIQLAIDAEAKSQNGISVKNLTEAISDMYTLGATGLSFDEAIKSAGIYKKAVGEETLKAAFEEGAKNAKATSRATAARKGKGLLLDKSDSDAYKSQFVKKVFDKESRKSVVVYDEQAQRAFEDETTESEKKFLELLSKKIGVDIAFINDNKSENRGEYKPNEGRIYLNLAYGHSMFEIALHEGIGEFLAASNEKAYNQIVDSVLNAYASTNADGLAKRIKAYQKAYEGDKYGNTARGASRELFNDALGEIFSSEKNMQQMFDWLVDNEGQQQAEKVKKTLVDYFKDLINIIKQIRNMGGLSAMQRNNLKLSEEQANQYVKQILDAMDQAIANRDAGAVQQIEDDTRSSKYQLPDKTVFIQLDGNLMDDGKGGTLSERAAYKKLIDKYVVVSEGDEIYFERRLPGKKQMYDELFKRRPKNNGVKNIDSINTKINNNIIELVASSEALNKNIPDVNNRHKKNNIVSFDTREVNIADNKNAYRLELTIANLADGKKVAYAKKWLEVDKNLNKKIKAAVKGQSLQKLPSNNILSSSTDITSEDSVNEGTHSLVVDSEGNNLNPTDDEDIRKSLKVDGYTLDDNLFVQAAGEELNAEEQTQTLAFKERKLALVNPKYIQMSTWSKIAKEFKKLGYTDITNGKVAKETFTRLVDNPKGYYIFNDDQAKSIEKIFGITRDNTEEQKVSEDEAKAIAKKAEKYFGTTTRWKLAGYLDVNGKLLDFSEGQGYRVRDHREIDEVLNLPEDADYSDGLIEFMAEGNIRLQEYGIDIAVKPNSAQRKMLRDFFNTLDGEVTVDFSNINGDSIGSAEYVEGTASTRILNDIDSYFDGGDVPEGNVDSLNSFRYSKKVDNLGRELNPGMQQYLKNNAAVFYDENGAVKNYYHGSRYAGFTKFSLELMDDGQSIFLTDNKDVANTYAGNLELYEPDRKWSYDELENFISFMTGGDWEISKDGNKFTITELGFIDSEDEVHNFDNLYDAQQYFINNYVNKMDLQSSESAAIYNVYVKSSNPLIIDAGNNTWDELPGIKYEHHYKEVNISGDGTYEVDYVDEDGNFKHEVFESATDLEKKFGKVSDQLKQFGSEYYENLYTNAEGERIPTTTREYAKYAKENGYDSLVINNVIDTGMLGSKTAQLTPSQIVVVFDSSQVKSPYNQNPTDNADIRYSIKVDDDRVYNYRGIEIVKNPTDREYQQMRKDILRERPWLRPDEPLLRRTFDEDGNEYYWEALAAMHRTIEPAIREHWGVRVAQNYNWWLDEDDKYFWPSYYEERYSKAVMGEDSQYTDALKQTKIIEDVLSTINNQLKGHSVSMPMLEKTVDEIIKKYNANLNRQELTMELAQFIAYMTKEERVDYNQMMNYLLNVGDEVIQASQLTDPEEQRIYDELKKELSTHKINITDKERKELVSKFGGSWNAAFGKLNSIGIRLNNKGSHMDGSTYSEIAEKFREIAGVALDDEITAVDQLSAIIDAMDALSPSAYGWEGASNFDKAMDVAVTIIDSYYNMASSIKEANIAKGTDKGKIAIDRAVKTETQKLKAANKKYQDKLNAEFAALVEDRKKVIQEQQEFIRRQEQLEKQFKSEKSEFYKKKALTDKEIAKTARLQAQLQYQSIKDTETKRKNKENIVRTCMRLINWMQKPTDTRHVPTFLKPALTDLIKSIDFMPASMRKGDDGTISAQRWQESMRKLQTVLQQINSADMNSMDDSEKYNLGLVMDAEDIVVKMDELLTKYSGTADISRMTKEDLKVLSDIMNSISKAISQMNTNFMNRRFEHVSDAATTAINEMNELKPVKDVVSSSKDFADKFMNLSMLEPISFFEELGEASESILQEFFDGEKIGIDIIHESEDFFTELGNKLGLKTKDIRAWENDYKTYDVNGVKISLTSADIMSLYCSYHRELKDQAERPFEATHHIMAGGIKGFETKVKNKLIGSTTVNRNPQVVHPNEGQLMDILGTLTDTQKEYADAVVKYMSTTLAAHGNKTSNKLNGYSKFNSEYYFPLKTDSNTLATTESNNTSNQASFRRLIFPSFTKAQLDKADNALVIQNFFDVVTEHITGMSNYCAYAMPISDAMRWYNYSSTERANTEVEDQYQRYTTTLKDSMTRVKGKEAKNYFETFIRDVNLNPVDMGDDKAQVLAQKLTGLAKAKAVGLNIRVILQQPCAIIRAEDVIEKKYLVKGWHKMLGGTRISKNEDFIIPIVNKQVEYAQSKSYLCYWKSKGLSDTRISQGMKEIITGQETVLHDIVEKTGYLAGAADDIAWASMYLAAEEKVKATTTLEYGTEEFDAAVEEIFSDIVNHTQVIDSQLRKTATMRSKSWGSILMNAFKKEPQKSYNMVHRAMWNRVQAKYIGDEEAIKQADAKLAKTLAIFCENAFVTAIAQSFVDAWRDDDEENYFIKLLQKMFPYESYQAIKKMAEDWKNPDASKAKIIKNTLTGVFGGTGNVIENADLLSAMPGVSDIISALKGYNVQRLDDTAILSQINTTLNQLTSSTATPYSILYSLSQTAGYITGIGADNFIRDFRGIYNEVIGNKTNTRIEKSSKAASQNAKKKSQKTFSEAYNSEDMTAAKNAMQDIYNKAIESGKDESEAWKSVREVLKTECQAQYEAKPEDKAAIINRFTMLLGSTKQADGKGGYRYLTKKEVENKINDWLGIE